MASTPRTKKTDYQHHQNQQILRRSLHQGKYKDTQKKEKKIKTRSNLRTQVLKEKVIAVSGEKFCVDTTIRNPTGKTRFRINDK